MPGILVHALQAIHDPVFKSSNSNSVTTLTASAGACMYLASAFQGLLDHDTRSALRDIICDV